ncbi:hypothetical protein B0J11DRAFT_594247 [Dendryphion nanum]|uniref:MARVEL domain-containing protein n=1 Tax=Dendryphion nanum TaxID=256645 RepID=A0A9P9D997_9PLEO|nr:hypothetical protein B0J11DRAFT_594247 [Dendryphion nanum]
MPVGSFRKTASTLWNAGIAVGSRILLLASAITISTIMFMFIYRLHIHKFSVPWAFFFLQGTALFTILALPIGAAIKYWARLRPLYYVTLNAIISLLWVAALILVVLRTRFALVHSCSKSTWGHANGISICRQYKILFIGAITGCAASLVTFTSDLIHCRSKRSHAKYSRAHSNDGTKAIPGTPEIRLEASSSTTRLVPEPYQSSSSGERYEPLTIPGTSASQSTQRYCS